MNKKILTSLTCAGLIAGFATSAQAYDSYLTDVDSTYQASYRANLAVKCLICHATAGGGTDKGVTLYANQYRATHSAASIKANDADGDGFTNGQEGALTADLNSKTVNPFTIKLATVTGADSALTDVVVLGDNAATQAAFVPADGGITVATGSAIASSIKVTLNNTATLMFKDGGIDSNAKVYVVNTGAKTNTILTATTEWVANPDGSVQIKALPAGSTFPVDIVVERAASTATAPVSTNGTASVTGCVTSFPVPAGLIVMGMLAIGLGIRSKA